MEAAACIRSIIATDVPYCREIAQYEKNRLLVPVKDPTVLTYAIERFLLEYNGYAT